MALFETELMNQYHNRHLLAFITVLNDMNPENPVILSSISKYTNL